MLKLQLSIKIVISILLAAPFVSCSNKLGKQNAIFLKQYSSEVSRINKKREESFTTKKSYDYLNEDVALQGPSSMGMLAKNKGRRNLPDDMFFIRYNLINYPASYRKAPISFDDITIPGHDAYGIETSFGEKNYILLDHQILQHDVDYINSSTSIDDQEIRTTLVRQQKELDRKAKLKNRQEGKDDQNSDSIKSIE